MLGVRRIGEEVVCCRYRRERGPRRGKKSVIMGSLMSEWVGG